ncbi:hypothetical protein MLD38_007731 [Melastoma candidum]|uniref:Uncharacterized protein n=1 Tax=Melastoma candidum TaxID=119954 RepID=A0ACB9RR80_9MYRT|nr:hypothetical protein MLD38_007731 [Melastoma candidum]
MGIEAIMGSKVLSFGMGSRHRRSRSFPDKNKVAEDGWDASPDNSRPTKQVVSSVKDCGKKLNKKPSLCSETHNSLKQEIMLLEKRLQDQFKVRHALEKALGYRTCQGNGNDDVSIPKPATELIKEIATLELEVAYLEQYLLTLYRKAFDQQSVSPQSAKNSSITDENPITPVDSPRRRLLEVTTTNTATAKKMEDSAIPSQHELASGLSEDSVDSGVQRCHSSLSQCSAAFAARNSPPEDSSLKAVRACHSQPMSMLEYAQKSVTSIVSLAEYLGTNISDHVPETPNKLSEDMIRCMVVIYCKLADSSPGHQGLSSPVSSSSSKSGFSPQDCRDSVSPGFRNGSSFETRLENPFHVEGLKEFSGPYSTMIEVPWIYGDSQKLVDIEPLLQKYRSYISRLEEVDLRRLKHDEKLAFWINIHNALVMHAFLAYGIPQNNTRRTIQLLKAAYNVGGHTISADTIQGTILGCRMSRPGQWIRLILSPRKKFKNSDKRQAYVVERPEALLHFALCYGSHSDPAVRVYTPRYISHELRTAKEEYIRATFGVRNDKKILLPKVVESFAKDSGMCPADIIEMVRKCLPDTVRKSLSKWPAGKSTSHKSIEWMPYNFNFRYLITKELSK